MAESILDKLLSAVRSLGSESGTPSTLPVTYDENGKMVYKRGRTMEDVVHGGAGVLKGMRKPEPSNFEGLDKLRMLMGSEETPLSPSEELEFRGHDAYYATDRRKADDPRKNVYDPAWAYPDNRYDARGLWLKDTGKTISTDPNRHGEDTFKQRGHPTFSTESKYAKGNQDAGHWQGEFFQPPIQRTGLPSHAEGNPNYIVKPLDYTFDQNKGLRDSMAIPADMDTLMQLLMNRKR